MDVLIDGRMKRELLLLIKLITQVIILRVILKKDIFVQAVGIQFLFTGLVLTFALFREGGLQNNAIIGSTIALITTALGMWFGWLIRNRGSEEKFRVCLYFVLLFIGLNLIRKGIF